MPIGTYVAVECAITSLENLLVAEPDNALGGHRSAKRLVGKVGKTRRLVEKSRTSRKAVKMLGKAQERMRSFATQVPKLLARARIEENLATALIDLSDEIGVRIEGVRAPLVP